MKKGDTVWLVEKNHQGHTTGGNPAKIATCGPKWITLVSDQGRRFDRESMRSEYGSGWIYETREQYEESVEKSRLMDKCRGVFSYATGRDKLSLDQLRRIVAILKESEA